MKNKILYIALTIAFILIVSITLIIHYINHYTIDVNDADEVTLIEYTAPSGDVYALNDRDLINQFIEEINGMHFERGESLDNCFFTSFYIRFYNADNEQVYSLHLVGNNSITFKDNYYEFISDESFDTDIFYDHGTLIDNIYD